METVFVAMSGGFDSFLAAYLLKKAGHRVAGITFTLFNGPFFDGRRLLRSSSASAVSQAEDLCRHLRLPHHVIDLSDVFTERVVEPFVEGYRRGITPNPCVLCNRFVKFGAFFDRAMAMGADTIATGHYVRTERRGGETVLRKGLDASKDQSYFLYSITKEALKHTLFPLGEHTKEELYRVASAEGLNLPRSRESQDICFIPGGRYGDFISSLVEPRGGKIYFKDGTLLGRHEGIHLFTIGQRRGINIAYREALYVIDIRAGENTVVVGTKKDLQCGSLRAGHISIRQPLGEGLSARVRYRQPDRPCSCIVLDDTLSVTFKEPIDAITPGQSVVLYRGDIVAGGGIIEKRVALKETIL